MTPCIVRTHGFFYVQHERNILKWDIKQQTNTGGEPINCESTPFFRHICEAVYQ